MWFLCDKSSVNTTVSKHDVYPQSLKSSSSNDYQHIDLQNKSCEIFDKSHSAKLSVDSEQYTYLLTPNHTHMHTCTHTQHNTHTQHTHNTTHTHTPAHTTQHTHTPAHTPPTVMYCLIHPSPFYKPCHYSGTGNAGDQDTVNHPTLSLVIFSSTPLTGVSGMIVCTKLVID